MTSSASIDNFTPFGSNKLPRRGASCSSRPGDRLSPL